jgi:hypothetical protein
MSTVQVQTRAAQAAIRSALFNAALSHFDQYLKERDPLDLKPLRDEMTALKALGPTEAAFVGELEVVVGRHEQQVAAAQGVRTAHPEYFPSLTAVAGINDPRAQRAALQQLCQGLVRHYVATEQDLGLLNKIRDALTVGTPTERAFLFELDLLVSHQTLASLRESSRQW